MERDLVLLGTYPTKHAAVAAQAKYWKTHEGKGRSDGLFGIKTHGGQSAEKRPRRPNKLRARRL